MDTYSLLREIADSWGLLALFVLFVGVGLWAFLPGRARLREAPGQIPFRNERLCSGSCADCAKAHDFLKEPNDV